MKGWFARRRVTAGIPDTLDDEMPGPGNALSIAHRACCCPARPVVIVVMPSAPGRPRRVGLLLCGHHYRASQAVLRAVGAAVYDQAGTLVTAGVTRPQPAGREPAADSCPPVASRARDRVPGLPALLRVRPGPHTELQAVRPGRC